MILTWTMVGRPAALNVMLEHPRYLWFDYTEHGLTSISSNLAGGVERCTPSDVLELAPQIAGSEGGCYCRLFCSDPGWSIRIDPPHFCLHDYDGPQPVAMLALLDYLRTKDRAALCAAVDSLEGD